MIKGKFKFSREKSGQEEIIGFILIIVLVAVIGVIFLGFSLRKTGTNVEMNSTKVRSLLGSMEDYTSECMINKPNYLKIGELIKACYNLEKCVNGDSACDVLKTELQEMLEQARLSETSINNYVFRAYVGENDSRRDIIELKEGNMSGLVYGADIILPSYPEKIRVELIVS